MLRAIRPDGVPCQAWLLEQRGPGRARRRSTRGFVEDDPRRHGLRTGFDRGAEDYQRTRPVCPPRLFDDLIHLAGLEAPSANGLVRADVARSWWPVSEPQRPVVPHMSYG